MQRVLAAMLSCATLCLAACGNQPQVVVTEKLVFIPPPAACLAPVGGWDPAFEPYGQPGEALFRELGAREDALARYEAQIACVAGWAQDIARLTALKAP